VGFERGAWGFLKSYFGERGGGSFKNFIFFLVWGTWGSRFWRKGVGVVYFLRFEFYIFFFCFGFRALGFGGGCFWIFFYYLGERGGGGGGC
jgi:hypothetical protein